MPQAHKPPPKPRPEPPKPAPHKAEPHPAAPERPTPAPKPQASHLAAKPAAHPAASVHHASASKAASHAASAHTAPGRPRAKPAARTPGHAATRPKTRTPSPRHAPRASAPARRGKPKASTRAVAQAAGASLQQRVYEMVTSRTHDDRVIRAVFLLCTAENNWNTETCNKSHHCGLFQLNTDWQRQHNYRDIGYWLQFALDHGFYGHGGLISIARNNPSYSIGGIVQACQGAGPTWDAAVKYYNGRLAESDGILARYHGRSAPVVPPRQLYFNPLQHARVRGERIDQGVDYAGSGYLVAIADGVCTESAPGGWAPYGNYLEYRITQPGPLNGVYIYYAEGISSVIHKGERLRGGSRLADIISGWRYGMELGFAAGDGGYHTYYHYHDGAYHEGTATRPGIAFDNLVRRLGGPKGVIEGAIVGKFPAYMQSGEPAGVISTQLESGGGLDSTAGFNAPGAASAYGWPGAYHSAVIQLQRGIGQGAHHSHAAYHHIHGITDIRPPHTEKVIKWPTIHT